MKKGNFYNELSGHFEGSFLFRVDSKIRLLTEDVTETSPRPPHLPLPPFITKAIVFSAIIQCIQEFFTLKHQIHLPCSNI